MLNAYIRTKKEDGRIVKATKRHAERLKELGYTVEEDGNFIRVQVEGFVEGNIDLSTSEKAEAVFAEVVGAKKAFNYQTEFAFEGKDEPLYGVPACGPLGPASCLMMRASKDAPVKKGNAMGALLSKVKLKLI